MYNHTTHLLLLLLFGAFSTMGFAQKLQVESFYVVKDDLIARTSPRNDLNGKPCAVIRVGIGLRGVKFAGNVMGEPIYEPGEYLVYMPQGNTEIKIRHADYIPLIVRFSDYGIHRLQSGCTYSLTILREGFTPSPLVDSTQRDLPVPSAGSDSATHTSDASDGQQSLAFEVNGVKFNMIRVEGGTFRMGATEEMDDPYDWEKPAHEVRLSAYYMGEMEVTQALWQAVMGSSATEQWEKTGKLWPLRGVGDNYPMSFVSWDDCQEFLKRLNSKTGREFVLPTEAQWEYAARGGNRSRKTPYSGNQRIEEIAWFESNSSGQTHPVGLKRQNELGLFDMSGNVWEWCSDLYAGYTPSQAKQNAHGEGFYRVRRGGGYSDQPNSCRTSCRGNSLPSFRSSYIGFRLVMNDR